MKKNKIIALILSVLMIAMYIPFAASASSEYREGTTLVTMDTMLKTDLNDSGTFKGPGVEFTDVNMTATELNGSDLLTTTIKNQNGHFILGAEKGASYRIVAHQGITYNKQAKKIGTNTNLPFNETTKYTISFDIRPSEYSMSKNDRPNYVGFVFTEADGTTVTGQSGDSRWAGYGWCAWINGATHNKQPQLQGVINHENTRNAFTEVKHYDVPGMWKSTYNDSDSDGKLTVDEFTTVEYTHFDMELEGYKVRVYVDGTLSAEWTLSEEAQSKVGDTLGLYFWARHADYGGQGEEVFRMKDLVVKAGNVVGKKTIDFDGTNEVTMNVGQTQKLMVESGEPTYVSSDPSVATVGTDGTITALKKGQTTITVTAGSRQATCTVTVNLDTSAVANLIGAINVFRGSVAVTDKACGEVDNQPFVSTATNKTLTDAIAAAEQAAASALTNEDIQEIVDTLNTAYGAYKSTLKFGAHIWDEGTVTTEPTTTTEGVKTYTCTGCGTTMTEKIKKLSASDTAADGGATDGSADETVADTEATKEGGCGSSVALGGMGVVALSVCGVALVGKKKKDNE